MRLQNSTALQYQQAERWLTNAGLPKMADKKTLAAMILCVFVFFWVWFAGVFYAHNETITNPLDHAGHAHCHARGPCTSCDEDQMKQSSACHSTGWRQAVDCGDERAPAADPPVDHGGSKRSRADQRVHDWAYGEEGAEGALLTAPG